MPKYCTNTGVAAILASAKVEQGNLGNAAAFSPGLVQTVAVVGLARGSAAGGDAADVHATRITQVKGDLAPEL